MLHEFEIAAFIEGSLPELEKDAVPEKMNSGDAYRAITALADYMKRKFNDNDLLGVKKALRVAETIYIKGNAVVKIGIENIFIYSLSSMMPADRAARRQLQAMIPVSIYSIYVQQILHSWLILILRCYEK